MYFLSYKYIRLLRVKYDLYIKTVPVSIDLFPYIAFILYYSEKEISHKKNPQLMHNKEHMFYFCNFLFTLLNLEAYLL